VKLRFAGLGLHTLARGARQRRLVSARTPC